MPGTIMNPFKGPDGCNWEPSETPRTIKNLKEPKGTQGNPREPKEPKGALRKPSAS